MPSAAGEDLDFSPEETLQILRLRKKDSWVHRATTVETLAPLNDQTDIFGSLSFQNIARIIMAGRDESEVISDEMVACQYSRLRSDYECDYDEMVDRLKSIIKAKKESPPAQRTTRERQNGGQKSSSSASAMTLKGIALRVREQRKEQEQVGKLPKRGERSREEFFTFKHKSIKMADPDTTMKFVRPRRK
ncbi:MAG: hypothetical protein Q9176_005399 [Flavoplaca citrina]